MDTYILVGNIVLYQGDMVHLM